MEWRANRPGTRRLSLDCTPVGLWASKLGSFSLTQSLEGLENGLQPSATLDYPLSAKSFTGCWPSQYVCRLACTLVCVAEERGLYRAVAGAPKVITP